MTDFITDTEIYRKIILEKLPTAREFLWIATADLKDLYVAKPGKNRMVPFLEILSDLADRAVQIRLIHAKEPGPAFRADFDRYPGLIEGVERLLCPRMHAKYVIVDGRFAYAGSANLTGAGMGAKSENRRNFEGGIVTDDPLLVDRIIEHFDSVWMGSRCEACGRKEFCSEHQDLLGT